MTGENLYELDISHYRKIENNLYPLYNLSSNWKGTCYLADIFTNFKNNYTKYINILNTTIDSKICSSDLICHKTTKNNYLTTKEKVEQLSNISVITSLRPSGSINISIPNFEKEFNNTSNNNSMGALILNNFKYKLEADINKMDEFQNEVLSYISNNNVLNELNNGYNNILNFDKTVAAAASIMVTNYINDKKMILNFYEFMFMFITSAYLIVFTCVFIFLVVFEVKKYKFLYYFLLAFVNVLVLLTLWEIVLSALFQGIRLFCRESPRVMKFLFTEDYILNGNTANYPPKFGNKDSLMIELFSTCLNGDGDLFNKFMTKTSLNSYISQTENLRTKSNNLINEIINEIQISSMSVNFYNNYKNNSIIYSSILKLEEMYNNLYLVSDNFEEDDIRNIINTIRSNLDHTSCGMTYEYYVIKKSDCPKYSVVLNTISYTTDGIYHCYIIQDLLSGTKVSYSNSSCDSDYINLAISFIKEINNILKSRIDQLKELQKYYTLTWNNLYSEIKAINNSLNNIQYILNDEINEKYKFANCSSVKYDLIDFSEFLFDEISYKLKIMIIFSLLAGILGYFLFYCIMLIINRIKDKINFKNKNYDYGLNNDYSKLSQFTKKTKYRNIRPPNIISDNSYDNYKSIDDNEKLLTNDINYDNNRKNDITNDKNKGKVIYNNIRKIEMRYLGKKNNI